jgi:arylsulfatase A-like enzyme
VHVAPHRLPPAYGTLLVLATVGTLVLVTLWHLGRQGGWFSPATAPLSDRMTIETVVTQLSANLDDATIVGPPTGDAVRIGRLQPGDKLRVDGGHRQAIIAPPPSTVTFRARVPPRALLRFGIGAERERGSGSDPHAQGVRFEAVVDGRRAFTQVLHPAATRHDRRWFDVRVQLGGTAARDVEIALRTTAVGIGEKLTGTPGWSHVRIVEETHRERQEATHDAPNVLLLLVDTLRADRLGCYGAVPTPSPTLDRLAERGIVFEQVIAQSPWTLPSVASLFTGLHPRSHGVIGAAARRDQGAGAQDGGDPSYLSDRLATLAEKAQAAGITTIGVSANPLVSRATNLARGFETFAEFGWDGGKTGWPAAELINRVFLEWARQNGRFRFFGYLHFMDVHGPYKPPRAFRPKSPGGTDAVRPAVAKGRVGQVAESIRGDGAAPLSPVEFQHLLALYDAQIRYWDSELNELLDGLTRAGLRENTIVVITSDHGEGFLEHGRLRHGVALYDELLRVPLVIAPGSFRALRDSSPRAGRVREQIQGIDVFPTVAALLGLPMPEGLPGQNVLRTRESRPAVSETRWGEGPNGGHTDLISVRTPSWKLIRAPAVERTELYDLVRDPGEHSDRFGEAPEGRTLAQKLADFEAAAPAPPPSSGGDARFEDKLRALGYVE